MALYTFTVEGFHIDTTRARGDDTDQVAAVLRVGNETLPAQSLSTGDVDGGDFPIGMGVWPEVDKPRQYCGRAQLLTVQRGHFQAAEDLDRIDLCSCGTRP